MDFMDIMDYSRLSIRSIVSISNGCRNSRLTKVHYMVSLHRDSYRQCEVQGMDRGKIRKRLAEFFTLKAFLCAIIPVAGLFFLPLALFALLNYYFIGKPDFSLADLKFSIHCTVNLVLLSALWLFCGTLYLWIRSKNKPSDFFAAIAIWGITVMSLAVIIPAIGHEEHRFAQKKCRLSLERMYAAGDYSGSIRCITSKTEQSYWVFEKFDSSEPIPLVMDKPGSHRHAVNILYSDGTVKSTVLKRWHTCEYMLQELRIYHLQALPENTSARLLENARRNDLLAYAEPDLSKYRAEDAKNFSQFQPPPSTASSAPRPARTGGR